MVTAVVPNADELIAARRASGNDRFDEVIRGVYFMVPPSSSGHGRRQLRLGASLLEQGLIVASEAGVGFPDDYVIPALVVYRSEIGDDTVFADPNDVSFVIEILSDSNVGTHWEAKLARLADWDLPVVIFDEDEIANQTDLPVSILGLFNRVDGWASVDNENRSIACSVTELGACSYTTLLGSGRTTENEQSPGGRNRPGLLLCVPPVGHYANPEIVDLIESVGALR